MIKDIDFSKIKFIPASPEDLILALDRLTRFKYPEIKYYRVFSELLCKYFKEPRLSKNQIKDMDTAVLKRLVEIFWNESVSKYTPAVKSDKQLNELLLKEIYDTYNLSQEVSVTLESEIECAKNYFDIWYVRMENKFEYEFDIDESLLQCRVIKFIIQPLIENAIKHGIEPMERKDGFVTVIVQKHFNRIIINVTDNGVGITEDCLMKIKEKFEKPDSSDKHIGLQNLYKRLVLFYGRENIFMDIFSTVNKSTQVLVEIPYREN